MRHKNAIRRAEQALDANQIRQMDVDFRDDAIGQLVTLVKENVDFPSGLVVELDTYNYEWFVSVEESVQVLDEPDLRVQVRRVARVAHKPEIGQELVETAKRLQDAVRNDGRKVQAAYVRAQMKDQEEKQ